MENPSPIVHDVEYLRKRSDPVDLLTITEEQLDGLKNIVKEIDTILILDKDLTKTKSVKGYGLSACQLESVRAKGPAPCVCCIRIPGQIPLVLNMINPFVMDTKYPFSYKGEGCLSFPNKFYTTLRYKAAKIGFVDLFTLKPREFDLYGFEAVVAQHEIDHMDGILMMDRERKPIVAEKLPGPNEPCPCMSGKKYKKCCGG